MKNHNEMYQSLLSRYEEYQEKKKKRALIIKRTVPVLASFCFAVVLGLGIYAKLPKDIKSPPDIEESIVTETSISSVITENITSQKAIVSTFSTTFAETKITSYTSSKTQVTTAISTEITDADTEPMQIIQTETQPPVMTEPVIQTQTTVSIQTAETTTVTTINPNIHEVQFGYPEEGQGDNHKPSSPSSSSRIVMKCISFCENGETLKVDTAIADEAYSSRLYEHNGFYQFEVYISNTLNFQNMKDERFSVNGQQKEYKKEYSSEESEWFDLHGEHENYDLYHHETTELDFSGYETGDTGCIKFAFMRVYTDDPLHPTFMGANQFMYFYVGEIGTSVSNTSVEDAIADYQAVTQS